MIIDKENWKQFGKGFKISQAIFGHEEGRYVFVLDEDAHEKDEYYFEDGNPITRFFVVNMNQPTGDRYGLLYIEGGFMNASVSVSLIPYQQEYVFLSLNEVCAIKPGGYKGIEESIAIYIPDFDLQTVTTKTARVGESIYAVGDPLRVFKRIGKNKWENHSESIEIPKDLLSGYPLKYAFNDIAGFSEKDMYVVGNEGNVWHFNGSVWSEIAFPVSKHLEYVVCAGDGKVYISEKRGTIWAGRNETWEIIFIADVVQNGKIAWFDNRLWCLSEYLTVFENNTLVQANEAKHNPVPENMMMHYPRTMDVSPDGKKIMVCNEDRAVVFDGETSQILFDINELEEE